MKLYIKPAIKYVTATPTAVLQGQQAPAAAPATASSRRPLITANIGSAKYILHRA